ncbi:MAG: DNA repair protein RecN [Tannerella sp.]|jgi:DNA repair protein RecN (Recombination protein N)|nr:DNA repair protein RecN [Tannerella sp.]
MLKSLSIKNFVLIDDLHIDFENGFSVMTGETGAGKSIILGALALVLGQRADSKSIQSGRDKCIVEAIFDLSAYGLEPLFTDNDLEYEQDNCILRRELLNTGKSRAFVNDTPVQLNILKLLGDRLIDVHSQHQNLLLADTHFQLNVVDVIAGTASEIAVYRAEYQRYIELSRQLRETEEKMRRTKAEEDYVRFQFEELKAAQLIENEQSELEQELETLSHTEEIKTSLYKITSLLNDSDKPSALNMIRESLTAMDSLTAYYPKAVEFAERLRTAFIDLGDLASEAETLKDEVEFNPERLEWVNRRLDTLYALQQKHRVGSDAELIACRNEFDRQLALIDSYDDAIAELTARQNATRQSMLAKAQTISTKRKNASSEVAKNIIQRMVLLGIPNTRFNVGFEEKQPDADGIDEVSFLFSANKNEPLKPVAQTASGGEISRLMLCVKAMIAGFEALPTIIFDEIDTGTSGEIADKMADIMQDLGRKMQVLTITHLPQIAAKGKVHYLVYKEDTAERTHTRIRRLDGDERIREIARMLSGASLTEASVANAKELLKAAKV